VRRAAVLAGLALLISVVPAFLPSANGRQWRVLASRIVLNEPERGVNGATLWPSDHYGVLVDLELTPVQ